MNFLELANNRYTTKKYNQNKVIPNEKIEQLKEIIKLSPSSINSQPWKFSFVTNQDIKSKFAEISYFNKSKINEANLLVVFSVIDEIELFEEQIKNNLPKGSIDYYNNFVRPKGEIEIKAWLQHQVYLSLGFFLSACASLNLDSSPMEGIENDKYDSVLQLNGYKSLFAVAVGYRNIEDKNQPSIHVKSRLSQEKIINTIK